MAVKEILRIDVVKPHLIDALMQDDSDQAMIGKSRTNRKELVCSIFYYLVKVTDVGFVQSLVKHSLVSSKQFSSEVNPKRDAVSILMAMIENCFERKGGSVDYSNLSNPVYSLLINQLLEEFIQSFVEMSTPEIGSQTEL